MGCRSWLVPVALVSAACSAPATDANLRAGERAEGANDPQRAVASYERFLAQCTADEDLSVTGQQQCSSAYLARAELLEHMGQKSAAAKAYLDAPSVLPWDRAAASAGVYRAGRIYLETGHPVKGYELLWLTVTNYPDQGFARDALKTVVRDGRKRNARELYRVLGSLLQPLADSELADNLLFAMAELAETEFADLDAAMAHYDKLAADYPRSHMRDDALWHGARMARRLGEGRGAVTRLRKLAATREVASFTGSYFSVWLDNGQLELGRILRDDLGDHGEAVRAFRELPKLYPDSILIDDSVWELAVTYQAMDDRPRACETLTRLLTRWPDSKYGLHRAPDLQRQLDCPRR